MSNNKSRILALLVFIFISQSAVAQKTDEPKIYHSISEGLEDPERVTYLEITNLSEVDSLQLLNRFPHLQSLSLIDYHFPKAPDAIANISGLKELKFINDDFYTLPKSYSNLTNLQRLEFVYDTHLNVQSVLNLANELPMLTELKIEGLIGPSFPDNIPFPSQLKFLSLRNNHLNHLPSTIEAIKTLEILDVGNNELLEIPTFLRNLPKLNTIYLDIQPFLNIDYTFKVLNKIPTLSIVHLEGNHLEKEKIEPYQKQALYTILIGNSQIGQPSHNDLDLPEMPKHSNNPNDASFKISINK